MPHQPVNFVGWVVVGNRDPHDATLGFQAKALDQTNGIKIANPDAYAKPIHMAHVGLRWKPILERQADRLEFGDKLAGIHTGQCVQDVVISGD